MIFHLSSEIKSIMKVILINEQATQFVLSYAYTALGGDKSSLQCGAYIIRLSLKLLTSKSLASHRRIMTPLKDEKRQYQRWMDGRTTVATATGLSGSHFHAFQIRISRSAREQHSTHSTRPYINSGCSCDFAWLSALWIRRIEHRK